MRAIAAHAIDQVRAHPWRTLAAVAIGWGTLLLVFTLFGDRTADGIAGLFWGWDRQEAYAGMQPWWPFRVSAFVVSYAGFALSAWAVSRIARPLVAPAMLAYGVTVILALAGAAVFIEMEAARGRGVAVPHPLFYIVSVSLPYQWRSGFLLVPLVMVLFGAAGLRRAGIST